MSVKMIAKSLVDEASTAARSPHILPLILVLAFVVRATFALPRITSRIRMRYLNIWNRRTVLSSDTE